MNRTELPKEPNVVLRLLCFVLGFVFFVVGAGIGIVGLVLWRWLHFPKYTFTFCSIPILLGIFFFGYSIFGDQDALVLAQKKERKPYLKNDKQEKVRLLQQRRTGSRNSVTPVPGGREATGDLVDGYYIEHSGSADF